MEAYSFTDTHAHLYGEEFTDDLDEVIARARAAGATRIFLPPTDLRSTESAVKVCSRYPGLCFPMIGIHPEDLGEHPEDDLRAMEERLQGPHPFIAIGEVGLDLYWDTSRKEEQIRVFHAQIQMGLRHGLPLMVHVRNAYPELIEALSDYRGEQRLRGVIHCFTGTLSEAQALLHLGHFALGIGGVVTFKKSTLPQVLREVPFNRLTLETDAPYLTPAPFRGKRNEPSYIPYVIEKLAEIYQVTPAAITEATEATTCALFPLAWETEPS